MSSKLEPIVKALDKVKRSIEVNRASRPWFFICRVCGKASHKIKNSGGPGFMCENCGAYNVDIDADPDRRGPAQTRGGGHKP